MLLPDIINGLFESTGAFFIACSIMKVLKDKEVRGVHWLTILFFFTWGLWNLYYYPQLGQWFSFAGGVAIALANAIYVSLLFWYSRVPK